MPLFVLTEVLCGSQPSKFVAPKQVLLKVPPGDMDTYTGSPGDEFTMLMLSEKQKRAWIANNPYQVNFMSGSGVSVSSLLKNPYWNVVGMVVCKRRTLPGPWELRCESDIGIAPLTCTKPSRSSWTWKFDVFVFPLKEAVKFSKATCIR
jgi:hypothetical protein